MRIHAVVALLALVIAAPLRAQTLTFNAATCPGGANSNFPSPWIESGFQLTSNFPGPIAFGTWCTGSTVYPGSPHLYTNALGATTILTRVGGTAFSILSIDLAGVGQGLSSGPVNFTGFKVGGGTVTQTFTPVTDPGQPAFHTFAFNSSWVDLFQVNYALATNFFEYDNIVLAGSPTATVPEPATVALLVAPLLLGATRRREAHWRAR